MTHCCFLYQNSKLGQPPSISSGSSPKSLTQRAKREELKAQPQQKKPWKNSASFCRNTFSSTKIFTSRQISFKSHDFIGTESNLSCISQSAPKGQCSQKVGEVWKKRRTRIRWVDESTRVENGVHNPLEYKKIVSMTLCADFVKYKAADIMRVRHDKLQLFPVFHPVLSRLNTELQKRLPGWEVGPDSG